MRKCDNCIYGRYALECNTGIETLYCHEDEYEYEVVSDEVCDKHQYIEGYEDEKKYVAYDDSYLGPGYFIIKEKEGEIVDFLKIYIIDINGYPQYGLRAFSSNGMLDIDKEFSSIEFTFGNHEDFNNGLFELVGGLCVDSNGVIETIDKSRQGRNNISLILNDDKVRLIISKDLIGVKEPSEFIDINIGDNYTCKNYDAVHTFYSALSYSFPPDIKKRELQKIISLKINK